MPWEWPKETAERQKKQNKTKQKTKKKNQKKKPDFGTNSNRIGKNGLKIVRVSLKLSPGKLEAAAAQV